MRNFSILLLLVTCASAHADKLSQAREHYKNGTVAYDLGQYLEAAREYEAAYRLKDEPTLLFNMGQAYRLGGELENALRSYRSYLRRIPDAPNRVEVEALIVRVQKQLDDRKQPPTGPDPGSAGRVEATTPAPAPVASAAETGKPRPMVKRPALWIGIAAGAVVVAGVIAIGVVFGTGERNPTAEFGRVPAN